MASKKEDPNFYETDQLGLASYLDLIGNNIVRMTWRRRTCFFVFERTLSLAEYVEAYNKGDSVVDPKRYIDHYVQVKRTMLLSRPPERQASTTTA